jgi:hypothetical protein
VNHPCIAQIHGFEQTTDISPLIVELVACEDLAGRIARGRTASRRSASGCAHDRVTGAVLGEVSGSCDFNDQFNGDFWDSHWRSTT